MIGKIGAILVLLVGLGSTDAANYTALNNLPECNYQVLVPGNTVTIQSANYPNYSSERCKYTVTTYNNHKIGMTCYMGMGGTQSDGTCSTNDGMYFQTDGSGYFSSSSVQSCALNKPYTANTTYNSITFAFNPQQLQGTFLCQFKALTTQCDCGIGIQPRIVGGQHYLPNSAPQMAAIRNRITKKVFGGSIVSGNVILSAGHGIFENNNWINPANLEVLVGCDDLSKPTTICNGIHSAVQSDGGYCLSYNISGYEVPSNFSPTSDVGDLALIFTKRILSMNKAVFPICLPQSTEAYNLYDNQLLYMFGWGSTAFGGQASSLLLGTQVYGFPLRNCTAAQPDVANNPVYLCTARQGYDSCQGDSGGAVIYKHPTFHRDFQAGTIVDGGVCGGGSTDPGLNLRTASYVDWIRQESGSTNEFCTYR